MKRLRRIPDDGSPGVCAGLAEYLNWEVTLIRLLFIFGFLFTYAGIGLLYFIMWVVVPEKD